jgi:hypothetical protein
VIRLLAPWREADRTELLRSFPDALDVNEVDCGPEECDDRTPAGRWIAGYFDDDQAPDPEEWVVAVAAAPGPAVVEPEAAPVLDDLRAEVEKATTVATLRRATLAYLDAITPREG